MHGSNAIAKILKLEGVEEVFRFPFTPIIEALVEEKIRPVVARQERVAENIAMVFRARLVESGSALLPFSRAPGEVAAALKRGIEATREGKAALLEFITREEPDMAIG
ncbi:MAG: hypothetical protein MK538_05610 [Planctomycetes bacterium]|nr:hypothetical protein [Planctomycetota bacterium]